MTTGLDTNLTGRTALITGGSKGLGLATAIAFTEAGANVAVLARNPDILEQARHELLAVAANGTRIGAYPCDVSNAGNLTDAHARVVAELGPVDILVNCAGQAATGRFLQISDAAWQADLDLKLFAAIRLSRLVWPHMQQQRWGRIINLLNTAAKAPPPGSAPTSVTRAAGMALTKVMAGEGAPHNILVNAMLIGLIKSDQIRRQYAASDGSKTFEEFTAAAGARLPMGRMGEAEECANLALFLASDASSYITGCAINMDGGLCQVV